MNEEGDLGLFLLVAFGEEDNMLVTDVRSSKKVLDTRSQLQTQAHHQVNRRGGGSSHRNAYESLARIAPFSVCPAPRRFAPKIKTRRPRERASSIWLAAFIRIPAPACVDFVDAFARSFP
jgi:hypothetical protein